MGNRMPGLEKNMREFIVENLTNTEALSVTVILMNNVIALIVAFFIMFTYKISYAGPAYSRKFNISIGSITIITAMIMSIISNNIALSLGMVGALSIIRFRTAVKDVRDATYIFWAIAAGIGCGVSQYALIVIGSAFYFFFLLLQEKALHPVISCWLFRENLTAYIKQRQQWIPSFQERHMFP